MNKRLITGDTHGQIDIGKLTTARFPFQKELTKDDVLIVLGDWGAIWYGNGKDNYMLKWWEQKPWTTFVVLGNHCNYDAIEQLPEDKAFGAPVRRVSDSIVIAETGNIYDFYGRKCLVVNGADSHDKEFRVEGVSWWRQEAIQEEAVFKSLESLKQVDNKVDYILSHTGGSEISRLLGFIPTKSDEMLDRVLAAATYKMHLCGHMHKEILYDKHRVLYNDIIELK